MQPSWLVFVSLKLFKTIGLGNYTFSNTVLLTCMVCQIVPNLSRVAILSACCVEVVLSLCCISHQAGRQTNRQIDRYFQLLPFCWWGCSLSTRGTEKGTLCQRDIPNRCKSVQVDPLVVKQCSCWGKQTEVYLDQSSKLWKQLEKENDHPALEKRCKRVPAEDFQLGRAIRNQCLCLISKFLNMQGRVCP